MQTKERHNLQRHNRDARNIEANSENNKDRKRRKDNGNMGHTWRCTRCLILILTFDRDIETGRAHSGERGGTYVDTTTDTAAVRSWPNSWTVAKYESEATQIPHKFYKNKHMFGKRDKREDGITSEMLEALSAEQTEALAKT